MIVLFCILLICIYFFPPEELRLVILNIISSIWLVGFIIYSLYIYIVYDREYKLKSRDNYFRQFPAKRTPSELDYLINGKINPSCVTSTLLNLIRKQVLTLEKRGKHYIFIYDEEHGQNLARSETFLIHWFIKRMGDKKQVSLDGIIREYKVNRNYFYLSYRDWVNRAIIEGLAQCFFEKKEDISQNAYSFIGLGVILILFNIVISNTLILIVIMFLCNCFFCSYIYNFKRRTYEANEEYVKWQLFKKDLNDCNISDDDKDVKYLEGCVIYAIILKDLPSYRRTLNQKFKSNPGLLQNSHLLKLVMSGDIIKISKKIEKCIKWSVIREAPFNG